MKSIFALCIAVTLSIALEKPEFTPELLVEGEVVQEFAEDIEVGTIGLGKVEAGFELAYESVTGVINYELDEEAIVLNEGFIALAPTSALELKLGQFVNSFGSLETHGVSDPLIYDDVETKVPAIEASLSKGDFSLSGALYQGLISENFSAFVPSVGWSKEGVGALKLASRIEYNDELFVDIATSASFHLKKLALSGELFTALVAKSVEEDSLLVTERVLGFYGEAALHLNDAFSVSSRFDRRVADIDADEKSGEMSVELSAGYQFNEPFCLHAGFQMVDDFSGDTHDWLPVLTLLAAFEL